MVEIRPGVTQAELDAIWSEPREIEQAVFATGAPMVRAEQIIAGGVLLVDGAPKAAAGIVEVAPKVGFVWLTASIDLKPHAKRLLRSLRVGIRQAETRGFRLVGAAPIGIPIAAAFMSHLGFEWNGNTDPLGFRLYEKRK